MNIIKKKAIEIIERQFAKIGKVLEVRAWNPSTFYEIDLQLPGVDMSKWQSVQHMKIKVAEHTFRDYTPAGWDAATETCTLYVDAAHDGAGSHWAASLRPGDEVRYVGISTTFTKPLSKAALFCLGDSSAIGHFLALEQLAGKGNISGALLINDPAHRTFFNHDFHSSLQAIPQEQYDPIHTLYDWLVEQQLDDSAVYLAGNVPMVVELRKKIKSMSAFKGLVKLQGFWW